MPVSAEEKRLSVYAGEPMLAALSDVPDQTRSGRVNWICGAYRAIVAHELRAIRWTRNEWWAVMDVLNGCQVGFLGGEAEWLMAWANLADAPEMGPKWGMDSDALAARWRALRPAEKLAVYEAGMRFWSRTGLPTDEWLAAAGVTPA